MIAITRVEQPPKLKRSKAKDAWRSVADVRRTLHEMQSGKCCYCETEIPPSGYGQAIEHYWPKSHYPAKRNLWANLLLACPRCNHAKLNSFPLDERGQPLVIDPTSRDVNPESEVTFATQFRDVFEYRVIGRAVPVNGSARGTSTIEVVGLADDHHCRQRRLHYERVLWPWLQDYAEASDRNDDEERDRLLGRMEQLMRGESQYTGFVRAFARQHRLPITVPGGGTG